MLNLPYRQIHLDFHTSELIPGIGADFDPDRFADTLVEAHVNSITCFSRCHHGMIYHDTELFPERHHPHLQCNLLPMQIQACHSRGIRVPIYITVQWDMFTSRAHPEWIAVDESGARVGQKPFDPGFYSRICLNTPYVDFLEQQTVEVCETMPVDGIFFDIVSAVPCCCGACIEGMLDEGLDPADAADRAAYGVEVLHRFQERMFEVVRSRHPEAGVFFNSGHVGPRHRPMIGNFTHLELESLPSGGWGYMHFPIAQRYARTLGADTLGMTGKFHTTWGDFHSFKNLPALEFECFTQIALNAKCSIGDQLHPRGVLCPDTYDLIGKVYERIEQAEPWCAGAEPLVDIGIVSPEEFTGGAAHGGLPHALIGATRMLQEAKAQFDIIDTLADFSRYRLLVLPDAIPVNNELRDRISTFIADGGSLLATGHSGLEPSGERFNLPELGIELIGDADVAPDFIVPGALGEGMRDTGHVMYLQGLEVKPVGNAEVLSQMIRPYFSRTWRHFCSHRHTPAEGPADYPGAVRNGSCIYLMHPLFELYDQRAPLWCKQLVANAIDMLLPDPLVRTNAPSAAIVAINGQPAANRLVLHLLHYIPERRGQQFDTIEDVIPIHDVAVSIRPDGDVASITLQPQGEALDFRIVGGRVEFTIPCVTGYQFVEIALA